MIGNYKEICDDVEKIILYSQEYPFDINVRPLMNKWYEAKKGIIEAYFNGNTSIEYGRQIFIALTEEQQKKEFDRCLQTLEDNLVLTEDLKEFLQANQEGFFSNRVVKDYPNLNIKEGAKLSKSFKRFIEDQEELRWTQDTVSNFIQENKIEGYLRFSVDPRDFLTLSENNENWKSCQSLDGDFRSGCLSYMTDSTTIIAYLSDSKGKHLKCLPEEMKVNSKKWRMLIHIGNNCVYFDKQYPYISDGLSSIVRTMIHGVFKFDLDPPEDYGYKILYNNSVHEELAQFNQLYAGGRVFDTRDIINDEDCMGYCDLIYSSTYTPIVSVKNEPYLEYHELIMKPVSLAKEYKAFKKVFGIKVGAKVPCVCCGQHHIERKDSFLCPICIAENDADEDFFLICDSCRNKIYDEDEIFWEDDIPYCKKCYKELQRENEVTLTEYEEED